MKKIIYILAQCHQGQEQKGVELAPNILVPPNQYTIQLEPYHFNSLTGGSERLADVVQKALKAKFIPFTLGGDHSITAGTISGALRFLDQKAEDLRVIWIDAHADINTFKQNPEDPSHTRPLASLTGLIDPWVQNTPKLKANQIIYLGLNEYEDQETSVLRKNRIKAY